MTMSDFHRTPKPFLVGIEDSDGDTNWFRVVSSSPLADMCHADLHLSLKDTLSLNDGDDIVVVDINAVPTFHHVR
ncbi:hypothetical protein [Alteromonas macleodii]|jgi:hypothetical protein|uniref:hypothetical protein n=1 Tax=Alteromonas macleodii TaxID=28108 RepID=UPI003140A1E6|tara:strand:+ start:92776 stop:93000 length:225 start_codon:yes stop_codon:yes gene_type:complete